MSFVTLDLETSSKEMYGRKANNFYNKILCIGLKYQKPTYNIKGTLWPAETLYGLPQDYLPQGVFKDVDLIIGHNINFDLLYLWRDPQLQDFFKRGGRIWCTAAAEFIISKQQHKFPKLRDIAVQKYGCKERVKNIEKLFESGLDTTDGDIELLLEDVKNDVIDTEQVALQQAKIAKQQGTFNLIVARMDSLLATCEMQHTGVLIDRQKLQENKLKLQNELDKCELELNDMIQKYWRAE